MNCAGENMKYTIDELDKMEGHKFEYAVADLLRHNGYREVQVTQASNDYGIDILAKRKNVKYAIQCKRYTGHVGNKAVQEAGLGMDFYRCDAAAVITNSSYTKQAVKLAETTGVRLWDRSFLISLIQNYKDDECERPVRRPVERNLKIADMPENDHLEKKQIPEEPQKITLANGIYLKNDKIYIGNDPFSFIGADRLKIFIIWSAWLVMIVSVIICLYPPFRIISIIGASCGAGLFMLHSNIKKALDNYLRLRIKDKK